MFDRANAHGKQGGVNKPSHHLIIGITGGIATGKSTVLREFARRGIPSLSSDTLARRCLNQGHPCYRQAIRHFGPAILRPDKTIHRGKVAKIVFSNPRERKWLERLIHPRVIKRLKRFAKRHRGLVTLDIPLLFEAHLEKLVDRIVVVDCSQKLQIDRLIRRNGFSKSEALRRIRSQWPLREKRRHADFIVRSAGNVSVLRKQVQIILDALSSASKK